MPVLAGLLNSHHGGTNGQAPKINLASETQGSLPLSQLPASNTTGTLPVMRTNAGDPNGSVAGNVDDLILDTVSNDIWVCVTTGSTSTAVWVRVSALQYNPVINGGCVIAQRASATLSTSYQYAGVDRWAAKAANAPSAGTIQQTNTTLVGNSGYALKLAGVSITGASSVSARYRIESFDCSPFVSRNGLVSIPVYQDTGGSLNYTITVNFANAVDNFSAVTQIAASSNISVPTATATTLTFGLNLGASAGNGLEIIITATTTATITTKNFYFTELQLRLGQVFRPFPYRSLAEELLRCQRYYHVIGTGASGFEASTTTFRAGVTFMPPMRTTPGTTTLLTQPTIVDSGATHTASGGALSTDSLTQSGFAFNITGFTGLTLGNSALMRTDGVIGVDAEL
jgi:hypothetical protein